MSNNGQENRRSFRIVEPIYLMYEVVSDLDVKHGLEHWKMSHGTGVGVRSKLLDIDARFNEKLYLLKSDSVALAECLTLLNEKITALLDELPGLKETKVALSKKPPQKCEIGADGMLFGTDEQFAPDTKLVLRFLLAADNRYVETFCKVVRPVAAPDGDEPAKPYGVAVEFIGMKPEQKEIIIQHLFDRESETLRMRRLRLEEDGDLSADV